MQDPALAQELLDDESKADQPEAVSYRAMVKTAQAASAHGIT